MNKSRIEECDRRMMLRAIALSKESGEAGEYPYGVLICRGEEVVAESINRIKHEADVTRHAEVVAISAAQKALRRTSLDDCVIYGSVEPCVFCSYAIRESRIGRVVYGLHSPHMGGISKWSVLSDEGISRKMPEVFAPPPVIVGGFMAQQADAALHDWNPVAWMIMKRRGIFVTKASENAKAREVRSPRRGAIVQLLLGLLRRNFFDRFGRQRGF
jgi:tRNA(adenine34) deaminase